MEPFESFPIETKACLHHLVEAQARVIPNDQGVCAWEGSLTYNQPDQLSNAVSEDLVMLGIGVSSLVPFALEKIKWRVIVTLAVLKTGAAFVPLNPNDPKARLTDLLKAVSARVVIITESLISKFEKLVKHVIFVPADLSLSKSKLVHLKGKYVLEQNGYRRSSPPNDSVVVLFTSGSTGTSKGMVHEHAAICTHALVHGQAMAYHEARVLQFAAHTFDIAIIDIFTTLLFGGCVCIPSDESPTKRYCWSDQ
jgi:non-ribosomal peptide synthetase component F